MRNGPNQPDRALGAVRPQLRDRPGVRIIPYDYVASFRLDGVVGRLIEDVINISVEGTFVAVAVGYGLEADSATPITLTIPSSSGQVDDPPTLADLTLANIPPHILLDGFRFNPALESFAFPNGVLDRTLSIELANEKGLFQQMRQVKDFQFLFNFVDTGSGRELQNAPVHSLAGLGKPNGERPFRMLARPLSFLPRSSVRIQIEEKSANVTGQLHIVLHGYKLLGAAGVTEKHLRTIQRQAIKRYTRSITSASTIQKVARRAIPSKRIVPFDYVATADLAGVRNNVVEEEVNINVEGGFVATAIGYSLAVDDVGVNINDLDNGKLSTIKLTQFASSALREGFKIRPELARIAFTNGQLSTLPQATIQQLFERLNLPENVHFRYSIVDTGTGREWQNKPVHNIAGLGIANGDRPFRNLAWPMHFLPRSSVLLRIAEIFGRGRLFIVFQGYKILRTS